MNIGAKEDEKRAGCINEGYVAIRVKQLISKTEQPRQNIYCTGSR